MGGAAQVAAGLVPMTSAAERESMLGLWTMAGGDDLEYLVRPPTSAHPPSRHPRARARWRREQPGYRRQT